MLNYRRMSNVKIINQTTALTSELQAKHCHTFRCKLRGLTFRRELPAGEGLLIDEKKDSKARTGIHMMFVFFDLGIVWINDAGEVVDTGLARQWVSVLSPKKPARYVLEIVPERLNEFNVGDQIRFEE